MIHDTLFNPIFHLVVALSKITCSQFTILQSGKTDRITQWKCDKLQ